MAKAPKVQVIKPDHNDPECAAQIAEQTKLISTLEAKRDSINADINAARKRIKALNVDMDAWRGSYRRFKMDPDQRIEFDKSRMLCDAALGVPIQTDLFGVGLNPAPAANAEPIGRIPDSLQ